MDDPQWRANKDALKVPDDLRLPSRLESVSDAIASAANHPKPPPALVGRVMSRHTLSHFGKAMDTKDGFPYRFTFEIGTAGNFFGGFLTSFADALLRRLRHERPCGGMEPHGVAPVHGCLGEPARCH